MKLEDRIAMHRGMAESYGNSYKKREAKEGADKWASWNFADDAVYFSPYFTGGLLMPLRDFTADRSMDVSVFATMEARAYTGQFPDWGPVEFKYWPSDNGFVMKTLFQGHTKDGKEYRFWAYGFIETNEQGLITRWETHVNGEEIGPFLEVAIGARGPFNGPTAYFQALIDAGQDPVA
jgi:hypothetical protein